jgi:hypothetical protein
MKQLGVSFLILMFLGFPLMIVDVDPAEAVTCSSVCNQIRRACLNLSKAVRKVSRADCDEARDICRDDCDANAATCVDDCVTLCAGDPVCEAGCPDECASCIPNCNTTREGCLADAEAVRQAARLTCDGSRDGCREVCIDPVDASCVRDCTATAKRCKADKKLDQRQCKRDCKDSEISRRACMRNCRRQYNLDIQFCADHEAVCLGGCAGLP